VEIGSPRAGYREIWVVWLLFGLATVAVLETYWRLPTAQLWKVSHSGFVGGIGRAFVFVSFSAALAALAMLPILTDRLERRSASLLALVAAVLCASVAWPGVQTENDLDPKWSNGLAVAGVALTLLLSLWATLHGRAEHPRPTRAGDRARLVVGVIVLFFATPYIAAELGFSLNGVPLLGWFFQTGAIKPEPGSGELHAAVHHGHHHGLDGFLLTVTALLLSRVLGGMCSRSLRVLTGIFLALMLVYGLTNMANDLWTEQVVKRGWTNWQIPDVLRPTPSAAWVAMLAVAAVFFVVFFRSCARP
jgi:hypothetical protein